VSRSADELLARHPELRGEDRFSAGTADRVASLSRLLERIFRFRISGLERVPAGPCLLVANHSIGSPLVLSLLLRAWRERLPGHPLRGLVHRIAYAWPFRLLGGLILRSGGVFAHPEVARAALSRGCALLVFPGGDVEAMRPWSERYRIELAGRTGFARLAREAGVPIVPLAICGSHSTFVVLPGGRALSRALGLKRLWGLESFPLTLGMLAAGVTLPLAMAFPQLWPLALLAAAQALLPFPARIEAECLAPTSVRPEESDAEAAERVRAALQEAMDRLAAGR
jgi:1-acyl-sn-glycerol-3-phosphate acyltransferase